MKHLILPLALTLAAGCGNKFELKQKPYDGVNALTASKTQIMNKLEKQGDLEGVQTSSIDRGYEVVSSKSETQYFVKDGRVVSYMREPKTDESKIIYWRYRFKDQLYRETDLPRDGQLGHRLPLRQLACDSLGMGVVYDPNSETVKRVFHYEQK
jgi:hypothetical protein